MEDIVKAILGKYYLLRMVGIWAKMVSKTTTYFMFNTG